MSDRTSIHVPSQVPLYLLRDLVVFPYMVFPLYLKAGEVQPFEEAIRFDNLLAVFRPKGEVPPQEVDDLHETGTLCRINHLYRLPDGTTKVILEGVMRLKLLSLEQDVVRMAKVEPVREFVEKTMVSDALVQSLNALLKIALSYGRPLPDDVMKMIDYIDNPARLSDLVALYVNLPSDELQSLLETVDPIERLKKVYISLTNEVQRLQVKGEVQAEVTKKVGKVQKEYILREQMKQIQEELGEEDTRMAEVVEFRKRLEASGMPEEVRTVAEREMKRLERINSSSPEYTVSRTYLDYLCGMPWTVSTPDNLDINQAKEVLDEDHYDLEKIKERILEYLAVRSLRAGKKGPILCFVGPPGVGKTSLGRSIARALGRKFIRMSLGGMRDEAEIRGHRRTYIGALPGRILQELYRAGSNNPVFMLDEVDKIGADFRGDPASALLEVLDPEQNFTFTDHYMDVPFDLSNVMFITTANQMDPVPLPLKDRMEVLKLSGYTEEEKEKIAERFLIPAEIEENGLAPTPPDFNNEAIHKVIREYTREAGVRNLQRNIGSICRKVAKELTQGKKPRKAITPKDVEEFLGPRQFYNEAASGEDRVGVVTGLAWTETGGDIIFIEATRMEGKGDLILTGSLGDVMKESARTALSYVRANCERWGVDRHAFEKVDIHIHVPGGAIPKDGPSAGAAMASAIISLFSGRPGRRDVAMTGEMTLTGRILPIGGLKEKMLASHRAGVMHIVVPERNRGDMEDIPQNIREAMEILFVTEVGEAAEAVLRSS